MDSEMNSEMIQRQIPQQICHRKQIILGGVSTQEKM
jgi:hypothetical protein